MANAIRTAEQLLSAREVGRCELLRGELVRMIPAGGEHGRVVVRLTSPIDRHATTHALGIVYGAETGFILSRSPDTVRAPDIAFLCAERAAETHTAGYLPGAPDLAVEVLSPDDRPGYVREKVAEWLEAGAGAVWVVDPRKRSVTVHLPGREPRLLGESDVLDGGDVLPGFRIGVAGIFG